MPGRSFLDSNVLVYTDDRGEPRKQEAALGLLESCRRRSNGVVSSQVLQEYFAAATRKLGVPAEIARRKVELFARFDLVLIGLDDILGAIDLHRLHGFSVWDALIVRAATRSGCSVLYSEDLKAGQRIEGLEIVNPFLSVAPA
ncbi:MAG TPA: PIN domain-containing protein [Thermoanaerobaculia bacterium]|nr:PIN domain-containing protein [Thermoanaerobaculia bacterium]